MIIEWERITTIIIKILGGTWPKLFNSGSLIWNVHIRCATWLIASALSSYVFSSLVKHFYSIQYENGVGMNLLYKKVLWELSAVLMLGQRRGRWPNNAESELHLIHVNQLN